MTPSPGIEPGPHWWEASALTLRQPAPLSVETQQNIYKIDLKILSTS